MAHKPLSFRLPERAPRRRHLLAKAISLCARLEHGQGFTEHCDIVWGKGTCTIYGRKAQRISATR